MAFSPTLKESEAVLGNVLDGATAREVPTQGFIPVLRARVFLKAVGSHGRDLSRVVT